MVGEGHDRTTYTRQRTYRILYNEKGVTRQYMERSNTPPSDEESPRPDLEREVDLSCDRERRGPEKRSVQADLHKVRLSGKHQGKSL